MTGTAAVRHVPTVSWRRAPPPAGLRGVPEECAVALTYNGATQAVMMATPLDLEDFAIGFSLSEGLIDAPAQIREIEIARLPDGVDLRLWLEGPALARFQQRRRLLAGPTGCGLCGVESLGAAMAPPPRVDSAARFAAAQICAAQRALFEAQRLHAETRAAHAAGFWTPEQGLIAVREDVGRHNALDKLAGALARTGRVGAGGLVLLTSRVSVEMVQKTARLGAPAVVAVSAPTALAVRTAEAAGLTLVARAREDGFEVFTHADRIALDVAAAEAAV